MAYSESKNLTVGQGKMIASASKNYTDKVLEAVEKQSVDASQIVIDEDGTTLAEAIESGTIGSTAADVATDEEVSEMLAEVFGSEEEAE